MFICRVTPAHELSLSLPLDQFVSTQDQNGCFAFDFGSCSKYRFSNLPERLIFRSQNEGSFSCAGVSDDEFRQGSRVVDSCFLDVSWTSLICIFDQQDRLSQTLEHGSHFEFTLIC
jgi:hypothetical protein